MVPHSPDSPCCRRVFLFFVGLFFVSFLMAACQLLRAEGTGWRGWAPARVPGRRCLLPPRHAAPCQEDEGGENSDDEEREVPSEGQRPPVPVAARGCGGPGRPLLGAGRHSSPGAAGPGLGGSGPMQRWLRPGPGGQPGPSNGAEGLWPHRLGLAAGAPHPSPRCAGHRLPPRPAGPGRPARRGSSASTVLAAGPGSCTSVGVPLGDRRLQPPQGSGSSMALLYYYYYCYYFKN